MKQQAGGKTRQATRRRSDPVDLQEIRDLLDLMAEKGVSEFELERGGVRLRLKRSVNSASPAGEHSVDLPAPPGPGNPHYGERVEAPEERSWETLPSAPLREEEREAVATENLHLVKSPIVGTFYEAPSPGAEPFVRAGDTVEIGQTLCVIEAMKLMNDIEADLAGEIVKCYVSNAQPVEYGEILFAIRPRRKKS